MCPDILSIKRLMKQQKLTPLQNLLILNTDTQGSIFWDGSAQSEVSLSRIQRQRYDQYCNATIHWLFLYNKTQNNQNHCNDRRKREKYDHCSDKNHAKKGSDLKYLFCCVSSDVTGGETFEGRLLYHYSFKTHTHSHTHARTHRA